MVDFRSLFFNGLLAVGIVLLAMELVEIVSGIPYFGGVGILWWACFLGWIANRGEGRMNS
ncbi:MAG: hypothetical protein ACXAEB_02995 [Candidatus Thorarchaeota archaeon]|jgi:hypothetical protein